MPSRTQLNAEYNEDLKKLYTQVEKDVAKEKENMEERLLPTLMGYLYKRKNEYLGDYNETQKMQLEQIFFTHLPSYFKTRKQVEKFAESMESEGNLPRPLANVAVPRRKFTSAGTVISSKGGKRKTRKQTRSRH